MKKIILSTLVVVLLPAAAWSATLYMGSGEAYTNLSSAFSAMSSGDTLIIRDGTYTGSSNQITYSNCPPAGPGTGSGDARFTIVKAENPGSVIFGNGTASMFNYLANSYGNGAPRKWIKWDGIIWKSSSSTGGGAVYLLGDDACPGSGAISSSDYFYWYFKGCGAVDYSGSEGGTWEWHYVGYVLLEDCFGWGRARYGILSSASDYIVVRRHIDRRDAVQISSSYPSANYMNYASKYVEYQNCLAVDTDSDFWAANGDPYGTFYIRKPYETCGNRTATNTGIRGGIGLSYDANDAPNLSSYVENSNTGSQIVNYIQAQTSNGFIAINPSSDIVYDHCTVINSSTARGYSYAYGNLSGGGSYMDVTNSVCQGSGSLTTSYGVSSSSDYNNAYGCGGSFGGAHSTTQNLAYQYVFKPEASFPTGNDSKKVGAKVMYAYGTDGTFYGESGYADSPSETSDEKLWPWGRIYAGDNSWEKTIWAQMRINHDTTDETRGFCQSDQSITNWIATAGGTLSPTNSLTVDGAGGTSVSDIDQYIYEEAGGDTTPPVSRASGGFLVQ